MTLTSILLLILLGLFLLIMEILFVPGFVLGIVSVILMTVGIIFSYKNYGNDVGSLVLAGTAIITIAAVYLAFKSNIWKRLGVQSSMSGKANVLEEGIIKIDDSGKTISRLNPVGKAFINNHQIEVQATEGFIDQDKDITVIKVQQNKIFVKLKD